MLCGAKLLIVPEKHLRPWTHTQDHLVTCKKCRQALKIHPREFL